MLLVVAIIALLVVCAVKGTLVRLGRSTVIRVDRVGGQPRLRWSTSWPCILQQFSSQGLCLSRDSFLGVCCIRCCLSGFGEGAHVWLGRSAVVREGRAAFVQRFLCCLCVSQCVPSVCPLIRCEFVFSVFLKLLFSYFSSCYSAAKWWNCTVMVLRRLCAVSLCLCCVRNRRSAIALAVVNFND